MLNGDSLSNWNPMVWSQNTRQPPSTGISGTTVSRPTSPKTIENEIHARRREPSPRPVANSGASASGANFAAAASATIAPRAGGEDSATSA